MQNLKETTPYRQALRDKILETAMNAFYLNGIRAVKMDDIARKMGISKRTLYEIYDDKEELLYQGVKNYDRERQEHLKSFSTHHHVIDIIMEAYRIKAEDIRKRSPQFFEDVLRYPKVEEYIKIRQEEGRQKFHAFMQRGVSEGFFRKEMNYEIIAQLFDAIGRHMTENKLIRQFSMEELFVNLFLVALRGICTPRGIEAIDQALLKFSK